MTSSFEISLGSTETLSVTIECSRRLKRMTLRVLPEGDVVVVIPEKTRGDIVAKAKTFAEENALWIKRTRKRLERRNLPIKQTLLSYIRENAHFSAYGKTYPIEFGSAFVEPFLVFRKTDPIAMLSLRKDRENTDLKKILRKLAEIVLPPRVRELAERTCVSVGQISIRSQRSRWGSCTTKGDLSLNWRLILLPPELQDHVIFHELAHRRYMDHSGDFWDLLNDWDPTTGTHDRELSKKWSPLIFAILQNDE